MSDNIYIYMKKVILLSFFLIIALSCSSRLTKQNFPYDEVKNITVGKTTQREIYEKFGMPIYHGEKSVDEPWWMYIHTTHDNSESLSLYFNKEGKVSDFFYSPFRKPLQERIAASR